MHDRSAPPLRRRIGRFGARLLLSLLTILLIAALIEFAVTTLDVAARQRPLMEVFTQQEDREIREGTSLFRFDHRWLWEPRPGAAMGHEAINEEGYRGTIYPTRKGDALRIVTLGDSSTFGVKVPEAASWPRVLESQLRERGFDVEVLNFGCVGYTAVQAQRLYAGRVRDYAPDIVVCAVGAINDQFGAPASLPDVQKIELMGRFAYRTRTFLKRYASFRLLEEVAGATPEYHGPRGEDIEPPRRVPIDEFGRALGELHRQVREDGGDLVLVSPPRRTDTDRVHPATLQYTAALHLLARDLPVPLCDVHAAFRARGDDLFLDPVHPTVEGHALYAGVVEATLLERDLVD